jgi:hypothetical protein
MTSDQFWTIYNMIKAKPVISKSVHAVHDVLCGSLSVSESAAKYGVSIPVVFDGVKRYTKYHADLCIAYGYSDREIIQLRIASSSRDWILMQRPFAARNYKFVAELALKSDPNAKTAMIDNFIASVIKLVKQNKCIQPDVKLRALVYSWHSIPAMDALNSLELKPQPQQLVC